MRGYALTADRNGCFEQAAAAYEVSLQSDPHDLEAAVNLMVLYWQVVDAEAGMPVATSTQFRAHARSRLADLLEDATQRFAGCAEMSFWKSYIGSSRNGEQLELSECRRLLQEHPQYFEPAFVVFSKSSGTEAEPEAMRLLADYSDHPTARGRYVVSIISGALRKQRFSRALALS
jgi:hypothetical protein